MKRPQRAVYARQGRFVVAAWSLISQRLGDPAFGQLVLPDDALGVDAKQNVHAMAGVLRNLGGVDAAIEPGG